MHPAALHDDVVDAALATASTLLGMQVVCISSIDADTYRFERVVGESWAASEGEVVDVTTTYCRQMLDGARPATSDVGSDPAYAGITPLPGTEITSYVGVPIRDRDGAVIGTLCGLDRRHVEVPEHVVGVLTELAGIIAARLATTPAAGSVQIRRTPAGWSVGGISQADSLTTAMVLADLLAEDVSPPARPERATGELDEVAKLRASVTQLEHALAARVVVEQAIGILAERTATAPRDAFESLRRIARRSGRRVHDLAKDVVRSVTDAGVDLPPELAR